MSSPNALAKFIKAQRADLQKKASPSFEEISDNAVVVQRDQPTFDNAAVAELRRGAGTNGTGATTENFNLPAGALLNPSETNNNQASPGPEKSIPGEEGVQTKSASATANALVAAIRAGMGVQPVEAPDAPIQKSAAQVAPPAPAPLSPADLSRDVLCKVASVFLETEEGCRAAEYLMSKSAAVADFREFMGQAVQAKQYVDTVEMHKAAAVNTTLSQAFRIEQDLRSRGMTEEDADICLKQASLHETHLAQLDNEMLKRAYAEGANDQAAMEAALVEGGEPTIPGGDEAITEEEVLAILQEKIATGEITLEEVKAALEELAGGAGGEAPTEGGAPPEVPTEAPPEAPTK